MTTHQSTRSLFTIAVVLIAVCGCGPYETHILSHHLVSKDDPHGLLATASKKVYVDKIDSISTENIDKRFWVITHSADEYRLTPGKHIIICSYRKHILSTVWELPFDLYVEPGYRYLLDVEETTDTATGWRVVIKTVEPLTHDQ